VECTWTSKAKNRTKGVTSTWRRERECRTTPPRRNEDEERNKRDLIMEQKRKKIATRSAKEKMRCISGDASKEEER
jgi:hypothetical protein